MSNTTTVDLDDTVVVESDNEEDTRHHDENEVTNNTDRTQSSGRLNVSSVAKRRRGSRGKIISNSGASSSSALGSSSSVIACTQVQSEEAIEEDTIDDTSGAGGVSAAVADISMNTTAHSRSESTKSHTRSLRGQHRPDHREDAHEYPFFLARCVGERVKLSGGTPPTSAARTAAGISGGTLVVEVPESHDLMGWAFTIKIIGMASGTGNTLAFGMLPELPNRWNKSLYSRPENLVNPVLIGYDLPKVKIGKDVSMQKLDSRLWRPRTMLKEGSELTLRAWHGGAGGQWWVLMVESEGQRRISPYLTSIRVSEHPRPYGLVDLSGNVKEIALLRDSPPPALETAVINHVPDLCPPLQSVAEGVFAEGFLSPSLRLSPDMRTAVRYEGLKQAVAFMRLPLPSRTSPAKIAVRVLSTIKCGPKSSMALGLCSSKSLPKRRVDMTYIDNASDLNGPAFVCGYELPVVCDIPVHLAGDLPFEKIPSRLLRPRRFVSGDVFKLTVCVESDSNGEEVWMVRAWQNDKDVAGAGLWFSTEADGSLLCAVDVAGNAAAVRIVDIEEDSAEFPCPQGCKFHLYGLNSSVRTPYHKDTTSMLHPGVASGPYRIGRHRKCNLCIDSASKAELVSRNHCSLSIEGDQLVASDGGGINGTFVNHKRLAPKASRALPQGCILGLGDRINGLEFLVRLSPEIGTSDDQADDISTEAQT
ncbi:hypothetical protein FOL47_005334 [Perkinsus chesapeaki]|uniref:FHA domain-containing protein n=1 Tax=Perkinsus chesapeaki TaxID=330153 RepID=A0A7J6LXR8_PERCH|nr:hypothetical protein FOL47_005334 [Perkinsus chesapeaki]